MRWIWMICVCTILPVGVAAGAEQAEEEWRIYRNAKFGYELSYPAEMEYVAYVDGASGELKDSHTGDVVIEFEVWPPDECPPQTAGIQAKEIGIQRAKDITQADSHGSSSYCGDPLTVREVASSGKVKIFELELTCMSEIYPGSDDDEMDAGNEAPAIDAEPIVTNEGMKGPTYFVDISQSWRKRVLIADPPGVDPRRNTEKGKTVPAVLRNILKTLQIFPVEKPPGICIEELGRRP